MRVAASGLSGFVGAAFGSEARARGLDLAPLDRAALSGADDPVAFRSDDRRRLEELLEGADAVVHMAGLAHRRGVRFEQHDAVNRLMTVRLAEAARAAGVRRFVYVSSLAVYGHFAGPRLISARSPLAPTNAYGLSKARAEEQLAALAGKGAFEVGIVRPPLVCGAGAPGNLGALRRAIVKGLPLPGIPDNRRDLLGVRNLASILLRLADADLPEPVFAAPVCDGLALSTSEIIGEIARGAGRKPILVPVPIFLRGVVNRIGPLERILGPLWHSLEIDSSSTWTALGIAPQHTTVEELRAVGVGHNARTAHDA